MTTWTEKSAPGGGFQEGTNPTQGVGDFFIDPFWEGTGFFTVPPWAGTERTCALTAYSEKSVSATAWTERTGS